MPRRGKGECQLILKLQGYLQTLDEVHILVVVYKKKVKRRWLLLRTMDGQKDSLYIWNGVRLSTDRDNDGGYLRVSYPPCSKTTFKESFPLLYKAAEELDAAVGEGFCVTLGPGADGTSVLTAETECRRVDPSQLGRKAKTMTKVPEIRNRMRKTLEERHNNEVVTNSKTMKIPAAQTRLVMEEIRAQHRCMEDTLLQEPPQEVHREEVDLDHLVQLIEGTRIRANGEANPKKAAKKARQKEKKEQERLRLAEEQAKKEEERLAEERRKEEEEQQKLEEERMRLEAEEERKREEARRKQMEAAERKKEEQRQKRLEVERRKAEEKRQKKEAKKQRREQRKKDLENGEEDGTEVPQQQQQTAQPNLSESLKKTETKKVEAEQNQKKSETAADKEKEYGRLKHEKEQRKREEEEARRLEQIQAQEKAQQNRKNKKKKKKQKQSSARQSPVEVTIVNSHPEETPENMAPAAATASSPSGQPLADLLNGAGPDGEGKPTDKNNLVTIRKHMNSTVTISMKGKEGEEDLVYTLMNGQVYPTGHDGKIFTEDAVPLQQSAFGKPETVKQVPIANVVPAPMGKEFVPRTVPKSTAFTGMNSTPHYGCEVSSMPEIDLSQLKLPPGITITKVPQHQAGPRADVTNGIHQAEYAKPTPSMGNYQRSSSVAGMDNRFNPNIMVVDSRCSSLESPVIGMRQTDMVYGANGTRASSEASIASDRPSSGLDSISNNNGPSPYVGRSAYQTTDPANKRVLISMSSPYAAASRNETPSPAWQAEMSGGLGGMPGMVPHIGADKHGFWNSTPNSPVAFPANSVSESYLRAQDQHFIKPRPQQRNFHAQMEKEPAPVGGYNDAAAAFGQAAPVGRRASSTPQYIQAPIAVNGTTTSSGIASLHFKSLAESNDPHPLDQWTPWTSERFSPEELAKHGGPFTSTTKHSFAKLFDDDVNGRWESSPIEKSTMRGPVNPYGPIGSNITRRSSNPTTNGIHGSFQRFSDYGRANLGGSSCT